MITLETALATARQTLSTVAERAAQRGYYTGDRTAIINSHAELCAALEMHHMARPRSRRCRPPPRWPSQ